MLDSRSTFGDENLTIRFATFENPENFGRKYPAAHLDEFIANLPKKPIKIWNFSDLPELGNFLLQNFLLV